MNLMYTLCVFVLLAPGKCSYVYFNVPKVLSSFFYEISIAVLSDNLQLDEASS